MATPTKERRGVFTVSLDFELYWGMRDKASPADLEPRMLATRDVIPRLLDTFADYGVHATWATVGLLFCEGAEEARELSPPAPRYTRAELSAYTELSGLGATEADDPIRFAPSLVERIARTPGQEVGTHTFGHFYCLEDGATLDDFDADLRAAVAVAARRGITLRSIVFPRNQYTPEHMAACAAHGIVAVRGNPPHRIYRPRSDGEQTAPVRAGRLVDAYLPLTGRNTARLPHASSPPVDIPATRFLRPFSTVLRPLEGRRLDRIRAEIRAASRRGELVHLWWHPHNFGAHTERNFAALRSLLDTFASERRRHGMTSATMSELAESAS